jgi:uncharacterized protein (TIRG00374 family)
MDNMTEQQRSNGTSRLFFSVGLLISGLLLWWVLRGVSWEGVRQALREAHWRWLVVGWLVIFVTMRLRASRWASLFSQELHITGHAAFSPMMVGYLFNILLPGRMGELARSVEMGKRHQIPASRVLATIVVERLVDALLMLLLAVTWLLAHQPKIAGRGALILLALGLFAVASGLFAMWSRLAWLERFLRALLRPLPKKLHDILWGIYDHFCEGLRMVQSIQQILRFFLITLLIWTLEIAMMLCFLMTFQIALDPLSAAFVVASVALGGALLPAPGQVGTFQFFATQALALMAIPKTQATSFALVLHATILVTLASMGFLCFLWLRRHPPASALFGGAAPKPPQGDASP